LITRFLQHQRHLGCPFQLVLVFENLLEDLIVYGQYQTYLTSVLVAEPWGLTHGFSSFFWV
jgi:hypothetical protein